MWSRAPRAGVEIAVQDFGDHMLGRAEHVFVARLATCWIGGHDASLPRRGHEAGLLRIPCQGMGNWPKRPQGAKNATDGSEVSPGCGLDAAREGACRC